MNSSPVAREVKSLLSCAPLMGHADDEASAWTDQKATAQAIRAASARNSSGRRRFVDPTTCEREYSMAEREFMEAMQTYKHRSGRMFPTWSEVLEVLVSLGYEKPGFGDEVLGLATT